jgi:AP-1 complex subunit gamma-1
VGQGSSDASDEMSDILAQIATNTDSSKNPGNSVLAECVRTIMKIEAS